MKATCTTSALYISITLPLLFFQLLTTTAFLAPVPTSFLPYSLPQSPKAASTKLFSLATSETLETEEVKVQRNYESFQWTNPTSKQTHSINYRVEGRKEKNNNPPILLIHGFGANVNHFRYNFPDLVDAGYCVYAIDLLGFGGSDKPKDEEYCIELWVDLLCDFVESMSQNDYDDKGLTSPDAQQELAQKWVVAGNSIGGLCSLGVAAKLKQQERIRGVTLFNCAGGMTSFRYEELPFFLRPILYFLQKVILAPDGYGGTFFENFKTRKNVESILKRQGVYGDITNVNEELLEILLGPSDDDGAKEVFLKVFGGPAGPSPESLLPEIEVPILALWGSDDPWTPVDRGLHPGSGLGKYAKGDFDLRILQGAGHCPHDECPTEVNNEMLSWMKEIQH